jgi:UDP-N-acetylmuramoylalanine--D-glutamate ligase
MMRALAMTQNEPQRALVVGLGLTGLSCVRYLLGCGYKVSVVDSREQPPMLAALPANDDLVVCHTGGWDPALFRNPGLLVVSPGVSLREPVIARAIADGTSVIGDIELFARAASAPVVAVTGANGKSTVTALLGVMCREAGLDVRIGGNIGVPALSLLDEAPPKLYVLELSSFQLETTYSLNAYAATVLNVSHDHMDRYESLAAYVAAKARIFRGDGVMVLNADDATVMAMARPDRRVVRFGLDTPSSADDFGLINKNDVTWLGKGGEAWVAAANVRLQGRHNLANALVAMALADIVDVAPDAMQRALCDFAGLPHRCQVVAHRGDVLWVNDSKATNVGATLAALTGQTRPVVLIAGGEGKGADFSVWRQALASRVRVLVLIGRDAPLIERALDHVVPVVHASDMQEAVACAHKLAHAGDTVLLSPGCASFDMFRNYEHRGEVFTAAVQALVSREATS